MNILTIGVLAPTFIAVDTNNQPFDLSSYKGKKIVLYFYPKDNTTGCTAQACNLRDNYDALQKENYTIIGISPDSTKSHEKFATKYELPFLLVADTDKQICELYGVWQQKKFMGKIYMGVQRTTFLIDETGIITHIIQKVDTKEHAKQILEIQ